MLHPRPFLALAAAGTAGAAGAAGAAANGRRSGMGEALIEIAESLGHYPRGRTRPARHCLYRPNRRQRRRSWATDPRVLAPVYAQGLGE
jgi:hypothetical protein